MFGKKVTLLFIVLTLTFLACSLRRGESPAQNEDAVIIAYTALEQEQVDRYLAAFNQEHPNIRVNVVRDSTGIITERILREKQDTPADVIWGLAATSLLLAHAQGILQPYNPVGVERVDPRFRDPGEPPSWVGIDVWMSAFCVNTAKVQELNLPMPTSWEDLLNPVYKGHLVMPNPRSSGTGFMSVSGLLQLQGRDRGWQFLDQLHENIAVYTHSGSKPCRMAGAGEYPIGISFGYVGTVQKASGEPITTVFPVEGSGWEMEANALVRKAGPKTAAKTFLDWAISDSAMREYGQSYAITGARTDQPPPAGFPDNPIAQLIDNNFDWAAANRQIILTEWIKRYDSKSEQQ